MALRKAVVHGGGRLASLTQAMVVLRVEEGSNWWNKVGRQYKLTRRRYKAAQGGVGQRSLAADGLI